MKAIVPADLPPADCLGASPTLESLTDVDRALAELAWIDSRESTLTSSYQSQTDLLASRCQAQMQVEHEGETFTFADRRAALEASLRTWCDEHKSDILGESGKKSRELTHGTIGWRASQLKIVPAEGHDPKSVLALIDKAVELTVKLLAFLGRIKLFGLKLDRFVDVKPSLSMTRLKDGFKRKELTAATLKRIGLVPVEPSDEFYATPRALQVQTEQTAELPR